MNCAFGRLPAVAAALVAGFALALVSGSSKPINIPRGEVIAFGSYQQGGAIADDTPPNGIYVMRADGSRAVHVLDLLGCPSWSPDGSHLIFHTLGPPQEIWTMDPNGTGLRRLGQGAHPAWSPDGTRIAFVHDSQPRGIYVMSPQGTEVRLLVPSPARHGELGQPAWSPDGTRLAFPAQTEVAGPWALFMADADGTGLREVPDTRGVMVGSPAWSPDGTRLVFALAHTLPLEPYGGGVMSWGDFPGIPYLVGLGKGGPSRPRRFGSMDTWENPSWSPDGTKIAFDRDNRIWVIRADGTGAVQLTGAREGSYSYKVDFCPAWSPIAFLDS